MKIGSKTLLVVIVFTVAFVAVWAVGLEVGKKDPISAVRYEMPATWKVQYGVGDMSQICYDIAILRRKAFETEKMLMANRDILDKLTAAHPELFVEPNEPVDPNTNTE